MQWRGGFSDRNGIEKLPTEIQTTNFDNRTRVAISNLFYRYVNGGFSYSLNRAQRGKLYSYLLSDVFGESVADFIYSEVDAIDLFKDNIETVILNSSYADILTLTEFFIDFCMYIETEDFDHNAGQFVKVGQYLIEDLNDVFVSEFVGYRIIDNHAVSISDDLEQQTIEESLSIQFIGCKSHVQKALGFLSDRDNPDYKNSIKESISAVESICCVIADKEHASLGDALKILGKKHKLNGQLKTAFDKLYSYTNDEGGIRHAEGLFASEVSFEEAKYMLVSCCAFVNYLIAEYGKLED